MSRQDKNELLRAAQQGNAQAFGGLVRTYNGYAYSLAKCFLGNEEDALDVVQETFVRVWKHLPAFDFRCKFTTWMYRIVINLCRDRARNLKTQYKYRVNDADGTRVANLSAAIDLENDAITNQLVEMVWGLLIYEIIPI